MTRKRPPFAIRLKQPRGNLFGQNRKLPCGCFNQMANGGRFLVAQRSQNRFGSICRSVHLFVLGPFPLDRISYRAEAPRIEKVPKRLQKIDFPLGSFLGTCSIDFSFYNLQKWGSHLQRVLAKTIEVGARSTQVNAGGRRSMQMTQTTPPPHFTNLGYCPKRPYMRMHAEHSVLPSVS